MFSVLRKLPILHRNSLFSMQCASVHYIHSTKMRHEDYHRPPPFDYISKDYTRMASFFDKTSYRFDDYTKLIIVDGPFGVGKSELAKKIAKEFDFHFEEDPCIDKAAYNIDYRVDMRDIASILPPRMRFLELNRFYKDPYDERVHIMQHLWMVLRIITYIRALRHIFNTGQGVVMNRSCMSFHCMIEGMVKCGFISRRYRKYVDDCRLYQFGFLLRPHMVIYLDASYDVCMERIRAKNIPSQADSKFHSRELHNNIEKFYKEKYFPIISEHSELLVFDWNEKQPVDDVVMEIEKYPFNHLFHDICKQKDWRMEYEFEFTDARTLYTRYPNIILDVQQSVVPEDVPELWFSGGEHAEGNDALKSLPHLKYSFGYNPLMGDNVLFKFTTKEKYRDELEIGRKEVETESGWLK